MTARTNRMLVQAQINALGDDEVEVVMSTSALARDGHVLVPQGCRLDNYRLNPIALWSHDPELPVGNAENIVVTRDQISARVRFAPLGVSQTADEIRGLTKAGVIRAVSVGFNPITTEPLDPKRPRGGQRISEWELLELSFVSVPADTGAVVTARSGAPRDIRSVETQLRQAGKTRAEAKRLAREWQSLSDPKGPIMITALQRALEKFEPEFLYLVDEDAKLAGKVTIRALQAARDALSEGPDPKNARDFEVDVALMQKACDELDQLIAGARAKQAEMARTARPVAGQESTDFNRGSSGGAPLLRDAATGQMIRTYRHDEPIVSASERPDYGIGDWVRASCTNDWSRLPSNIRAGSAGLGSAGGFLIPSELSNQIIDLARAKARVLEAGAQTVPMSNGNLSVAYVTGDPQAQWRAENAAFAVSQGSYGRIELTTKVLGVIVPLSVELLMSTSNINELVTGQLVKRLGLQLDQAAIAGDGTQDQPRGVTSWLSAESQVIDVGAPLTSLNAYGSWSKAIGKVLAANAELSDLSILHNSDVDTALDGLQDTLNQPLRPTPNYAKIRDAGRTFVANGIPTSGTPTATYSLVGDFSQVLFGMQQSLMIEVSREGSYESGGSSINAFSRGQVLIRAMIACDVAVLRPTFFAQVNDIRIA